MVEALVLREAREQKEQASTGGDARATSGNVLALSADAARSLAGDLRDGLRRLMAEPDDEAVHDVRVACRRLRTALDISGPLCRKPLLKAARKRIKGLLSSLGEIRDSEVFAERARREAGLFDAAGLLELAALFDAQTRLAFLHATAHVDRERFATLPRLVESLFEPAALCLKGLARWSTLQAGDLAGRVLNERLADVERCAEKGAEASSGELHALRIAFKKLRYAAEFFSPVLHMKAIVRAAEAYQEVLGDLHDADVAITRLSPWLRRSTPPLAMASALPPAAVRDLQVKPHDNMNELFRALGELVNSARADQARLRAEFASQWSAAGLTVLRESIAALPKPGDGDGG